MISKIFLAIFAISAVQAQYFQYPDKVKLSFKLSASNLKDKDKLGTTDPYVELFYTEGTNGDKKSFARTNTITDSLNPSWGETFTFDYDRSKSQKWYFKIYDHDQGREDDTVGRVWVTVQDYVEKNQQYTANLDKQGTLTISASDPNSVPRPGNQPPNQYQPAIQPQPAVQPQVISPQVISPQQPGPAVIPVATYVQQQDQRIKFKLSARGLPDTDILGTIDPYVKVYKTESGQSGETLIGRTAPLSDKENPDWTETFEFVYAPNKGQKLRFLVLDNDENRRDDEVGNVFVEPAELMTKSEVVVPLSKGSLHIKRI